MSKSIENLREELDIVCAIGNVVAPTLSAALDELAALREENAKLKNAVRRAGVIRHATHCYWKQSNVETLDDCSCGANDHNALVRSVQ